MTMILISAALCFLSLFEVCRCCNFGSDEVVRDFDISKMTGPWWEYQTFDTKNLYDAYDHDCLVTQFYPNANPRDLTIVQDFIKRLPGTANKEHTRKEWKLYRGDYVSNHRSGVYSGEMISPETFKRMPYNYYVLGTDYSTWLMAAFCSPNDILNGIQVLTTKQVPSESEQQEIEKNIRSVLIGEKMLRGTSTIKDNRGCKPVNFPNSEDVSDPLRLFSPSSH